MAGEQADDGKIIYEEAFGPTPFQFITYPDEENAVYLYIDHIERVKGVTSNVLKGFGFSSENKILNMSAIVDKIVDLTAEHAKPILPDRY